MFQCKITDIVRAALHEPAAGAAAAVRGVGVAATTSGHRQARRKVKRLERQARVGERLTAAVYLDRLRRSIGVDESSGGFNPDGRQALSAFAAGRICRGVQQSKKHIIWTHVTTFEHLVQCIATEHSGTCCWTRLDDTVRRYWLGQPQVTSRVSQQTHLIACAARHVARLGRGRCANC